MTLEGWGGHDYQLRRVAEGQMAGAEERMDAHVQAPDGILKMSKITGRERKKRLKMRKNDKVEMRMRMSNERAKDGERRIT